VEAPVRHPTVAVGSLCEREGEGVAGRGKRATVERGRISGLSDGRFDGNSRTDAFISKALQSDDEDGRCTAGFP
jgi:hypothetical protein